MHDMEQGRGAVQIDPALSRSLTIGKYGIYGIDGQKGPAAMRPSSLTVMS